MLQGRGGSRGGGGVDWGRFSWWGTRECGSGSERWGDGMEGARATGEESRRTKGFRDKLRHSASLRLIFARQTKARYCLTGNSVPQSVPTTMRISEPICSLCYKEKKCGCGGVASPGSGTAPPRLQDVVESQPTTTKHRYIAYLLSSVCDWQAVVVSSTTKWCC